MRKLFITSVCTLGLTLLSTFGGYQSSLNLPNDLSADNKSTTVEQNVTNSEDVQGLPITNTAVKGAVAENKDNKEGKAVKTSSEKKSEAKKNKNTKINNKKNNKAKNTKTTSDVKAANTTNSQSKTPELTYKNIDLSDCNSVKEVVAKLQKNGCTNVTSSNINNISSLKDILANIDKSGCQSGSTTKPTATPAPTTKPTATPAPTTKPTATPAPTTKPTATPAPTTKPTATPAPTTKPAATPTPTPTTTKSSDSSDVSSYANQVLQLVNQERAKAGLSALTTNSTLTNAANKRAKETVQSFSHTRPDGTNFSTVLKEFNISYRAAGENIAYGQKSPQEVVTGWMNSPGHRANILNANFGKIGIGVYKSNGVIYWSQLFTN